GGGLGTTFLAKNVSCWEPESWRPWEGNPLGRAEGEVFGHLNPPRPSNSAPCPLRPSRPLREPDLCPPLIFGEIRSQSLAFSNLWGNFLCGDRVSAVSFPRRPIRLGPLARWKQPA